MKSVRRTSHGWQLYARIRGRFVSEHRATEPTPAQVRDWVGLQRAIAAGLVTEPEADAPTFAEDVRDYLAQVQTMTTYAWRKADLDLWIAVFGQRQRSDITSGMIRAQLETWRKAGYAASTVNHRRTALMHLWSVLDGKSAQNPARDVPRYREAVAPPRDLSPEAIDAILAAMPDGPMRARLVLMRWTGWPQQQIRTLTTAQIRWHVAVNMRRNKGAGVAPRWIPLLPAAWTALERLRDLDAFGTFASWELRAAFRRAARRAQADEALPDDVRRELADVTPYQLRHTFGTLIAGITKDDRATMELMIQSDIRQTHRYTGSTVNPRLAAALETVTTALATLATSAGDQGVSAGSGGTAKARKSGGKRRK